MAKKKRKTVGPGGDFDLTGDSGLDALDKIAASRGWSLEAVFVRSGSGGGDGDGYGGADFGEMLDDADKSGFDYIELTLSRSKSDEPIPQPAGPGGDWD